MTDQQWQAAWKLYQSGSSIDPEQLHSFLNIATSDLEVRSAVLGMIERPKKADTLDRIGQRVGRYVLTEYLGEGGMGEVHAAHDSELGRSVAVKLLTAPSAATLFPVDRFVHEAKAASALNHPNIVTIYEVIHTASMLAIVMERVDGTPLRQLCGSPVPVDRVMHMGEQIARALAAAHVRGIVHCDIKPENLIVRQDGFVKVMDFGLARDVSLNSSSILPAGTLRYMSPEQSRGEAPPPASDVFSLGIVLYELVAGTHPFEGNSIFETLTALNQSEPAAPSSSNPFVPADLDALILAMLAKDPSQRPGASEVAKLFESRFASQPMMSPASGLKRIDTGKRERRPRRKLRWAAGTLASAALAIGFISGWATRPISRPLIRFDIDLGRDAVTGRAARPAVSPDGTRLAYVVRSASGAGLLATRQLDQSEPVVFAGAEDAYEPFFSPDGQWIGFFTNQSLKKISVNGGAPVRLCPAEAGQRGAAWGTDGFIIANLDNSHLVRIPESGGKPEMLSAQPEQYGERTWRWPQILPGGRQVLFTGSRDSGSGRGFEEANLEVLSLDTGKVTVVQRGGYFGRYLPSGHLVYVHEGTLFGVPLDLAKLKTRGAPVPILDDVAGDAAIGFGTLDFSMAADKPGILAYRSGKSSEGPSRLAWMDSTDTMQTLLTALAPMTPGISPDGKFVALSIAGNIVRYDLERGTNTSLTRNGLRNNSPVWTQDGRHIVFDQDGGDESAIWWIRADGSGEPRKLFATVDDLRLRSISPDGRYIAFARQNAVTGWDIWTLPLDLSDPDRPKPGRPKLLVGEPYDQFSPNFSPDRRWMAYVGSKANSAETEIYVMSFPGSPTGRKWRVSRDGGTFPVWSRDGKELLFYASNRVMRVKYKVNGMNFAAGKPQVWSPSPVNWTLGMYWNFDLAPNSKLILAFPAPDAAENEKPSFHVTVLLNFFDELKRKVP
jgi:serine/threonine-protein kinase